MGDGLSIGIGAAESWRCEHMTIGAGLVIVTTGGVPIGSPLVAGGAALTTHGSVVMGKALLGFSKHKKEEYQGKKHSGPNEKHTKLRKPNTSIQNKKLSAGEIKKLKDVGYDIHVLKGNKNASTFDLCKDYKGNVVVKLKRGKGDGEPIGISLNALA